MEARDFDPSRPELEVITTDPEFTDLGNAERLIERHGHELRYVPQWGWLVWDGTRWKRDEHDEVMEFAKETVRNLRREAAETNDGKRGRALWDHANRSEARYRLEAMVKLAQSDRSIQARIEDFDRDPWLFNCQNGTLDLRTGELRPHNPADHLSKIAKASYDPNAASDVFQNFLAGITCGV